MVIYRPGLLPERGVVRYEGGPWHGHASSVPWPLSAGNVEPITDVGYDGLGSYRRISYSETPPLNAVYQWDPSE